MDTSISTPTTIRMGKVVGNVGVMRERCGWQQEKKGKDSMIAGSNVATSKAPSGTGNTS